MLANYEKRVKHFVSNDFLSMNQIKGFHEYWK